MKNTFYTLLFCLFSTLLFGQDAAYSIFGLKAGTSIGFQTWNNIDQDALFAYNAGVFAESLDGKESKSSLYAGLSYSQKGSAKRNVQLFNSNGSGSLFGGTFTRKYIFHNAILNVGAKKRLEKRSNGLTPYYSVGVFGSYTLATNLGEQQNNVFLFDPIDENVRKINYGLHIGGGFEKQISDYIGMHLDISVFPEISNQYVEQYGSNPPIIINPYSGQPITLRDRNIKNLTFEITIGIRFLREIIYVD
jgi:hypothetical protein